MTLPQRRGINRSEADVALGPGLAGFAGYRRVDLPHGLTAGVTLAARKVLLGHRNGDITTHYSAPELEELLVAVNKVCEEKSGKSPALVILKQKTAGV